MLDVFAGRHQHRHSTIQAGFERLIERDAHVEIIASSFRRCPLTYHRDVHHERLLALHFSARRSSHGQAHVALWASRCFVGLTLLCGPPQSREHAHGKFPRSAYTGSTSRSPRTVWDASGCQLHGSDFLGKSLFAKRFATLTRESAWWKAQCAHLLRAPAMEDVVNPMNYQESPIIAFGASLCPANVLETDSPSKAAYPTTPHARMTTCVVLLGIAVDHGWDELQAI
nr:hypothetical protein CFP56_10144 [Quercus suber]